MLEIDYMFLIDLGRESNNSVELVFASSHKRVYTDQSIYTKLSQITISFPTESQSNC